MASSTSYRDEHFFWQIAYNTASQAGFQFSPDCEQDLKNQIRLGLSRLRKDQGDEFRFENSIANLVFAMIQVLREKDSESRVLREFSLQGALRKLCPLYPFC
jgi:hypothetical protein